MQTKINNFDRATLRRVTQFILIVLLTAPALADDEHGNRGFLSDYSVLQPVAENGLTRYYLKPDAAAELASYTSIMVDQPEIFIAIDSPYRSIKPAYLNAIAEYFRGRVIDVLSDQYTVVDQAGPGVLYLKLALMDLSVTKKRTRVLGYTPVGVAVRTVKHLDSSSFDNSIRHLSLASLEIEGEVQDSQTTVMLGEFQDDLGGESSPTSWKELQQELRGFASMVACHMKNAMAENGERATCIPQPAPKSAPSGST